MAVLGSCKPKTAYMHYEHLPVEGWEDVDTLTYCIEKVKDAGFYDVKLGMRTTSQYPFTQLSVVVRQEILPAGRHRTDTLVCNLVGSNGRRLGNGVSLYHYDLSVCEQQLLQGDSMTIKVYHNMRKETVQGIADVGVCVERH